MRSAAKFHSVRQKWPQETSPPCPSPDRWPAAAAAVPARVAAFFAISSAGNAGLAAGAILQRLQIQHQPLFFSIGAAALLVEALPGLIAQPAALHNLFQTRRRNRPASRPAENSPPRAPECRCPPCPPAETFRCAASRSPGRSAHPPPQWSAPAPASASPR